MAPLRGINLIKSPINEIPLLAGMIPLLQRMSIICLASLIISGLATGAVYYYLFTTENSRILEKNSRVSTVKGESVKEGLFVAIKARAATVSNLTIGQKNISALLDMLGQITTPAQLETVSLSENKVLLAAKTESIAETMILVDALMKVAAAGKITKPELISFNLHKDGGFKISLSFVTVL
jgi:hypothetical protein